MEEKQKQNQPTQVYQNPTSRRIEIHSKHQKLVVRDLKTGLFLEEISKFPREREYLFTPGRKFRVLDVEVGEVYQGMKKFQSSVTILATPSAPLLLLQTIHIALYQEA